MRSIFITALACTIALGCGNARGGGGGGLGGGSAAFGVAGAQWDVTFSSMRGLLTSNGRAATFLLTDANEGQQLNGFDSATGNYGPINCRRTVNRTELGLVYANDSSRFIVTVTNLRQYDGSGCEANGYTVSASPTRRSSDGFTVVRMSNTPSVFGELGGAWQILDYRGRIQCNLTVSGSSFNGDCDGYTFQGTISGSMVAGTDNRRGSFAGSQR
jgi:hypothetical protein